MAVRTAPHWAEIGERTSVVGVRLLCWIFRRFGRWPYRACALPAVAFHWLCNGLARRSSLQYLERLQAHTGALGHAPGWRDSLRHFALFGDTMLDKLLALGGRFPPSRLQLHENPALQRIVRGDGGVFLTAHVGCLELCQALAGKVPGLRLTVLVHTHHAQRFNGLLARLGSLDSVDLVQVTDVGPAMAMTLAHRVAAGGFVAIVGDRVPVRSARVVHADFLGHRAPFPVGAYVLAAALGCPVYTLSCLHDGDGYRVRLDLFAERVELPRATRSAALAAHAQRYAHWLERQLVLSPLDWFNFFPFWDQAPDAD